ncbi:MAG: 50S ribosomal protein L6 [Proteobacteria bacterium]|nr:50S ribosomal protein L6 [Pseudomonadota bacterium]NOG60264.1 50S ribosomal protein L6 [Pseudomonadota bacterium]
MSRIANNPVTIPSGVDVNIAGSLITVKGSKGELSHDVHPLVKVEQEDGALKTKANNDSKSANALSGTTRALLQNLITGVSDGFERKLEIVGVGYRAAVSGKVLNLSLGFSHPVDFAIPEGITIETPSQTEVVIKGADKQQVGQVAANIRAYRPPEPYKGKGVRYSDERIIRKEAKKA